MKILKALMLAILAWSTAPAQATTISFSYIGTDLTAPTIIPGQGRLIRVTDAVGTFSLRQRAIDIGAPLLAPQSNLLSGTFGFGDLESFNLDTNTIFTFSDVNPSGFPSSGFYNYGLADLSTFSATFANGVLTALSFETLARATISNTGAGIFERQIFRVSSLDPDGAGTFGVDRRIITRGQIELAAVPEPAAWAMMIIGFGMIGGALRTRRRQIVYG